MIEIENNIHWDTFDKKGLTMRIEKKVVMNPIIAELISFQTKRLPFLDLWTQILKKMNKQKPMDRIAASGIFPDIICRQRNHTEKRNGVE